jgi:EAL domain-containing protein (putative c-di-GMP-specific phosphodiesterase class I)/CHASE2 domain-containing sensor protein
MMTDSPSPQARKTPAGKARNRRLWLWACATLLGVLIQIGHVPETMLMEAKARFYRQPASGRIVVVSVDKAVAEIGQWPVPRTVYAHMLDRLFALGARRVFVNIELSSRQDPAEDEAMAAAMRAHPDRVFLSGRFLIDQQTGARRTLLPTARLRDASAGVVDVNYMFDSAGVVWRLPYAMRMEGRVYPSMAAALAERSGETGAVFVVDGSTALNSIPHIELSDLLRGGVSRAALAGKDVVVGGTSDQLLDTVTTVPYGRVGGVYLHTLGAETLIRGGTIFFGGWPLLLLASALVLTLGLMARRRSALLIAGASAIGTPLFAVLLPPGLFVGAYPALAVLLVAVVALGGREITDLLRLRTTVNIMTGLHNLVALRQLDPQPDLRLVVAHIHNFAEVTASLPAESETALIAQVASRLELGMVHGDLYHGDNGVFAWFAREPMTEIGERLDALHALFRSPITVGAGNVDLAVTFGVDADGARSVANRLGSALVAAAEADAEGAKWREFDQKKLADAAWKLSLLSQLDAAIDDGHLWVAYQPKLDLHSRRLTGAEALVRWTHPEKGPISPIEFVAAAEQHNRIERLTAHVLDRAVLAAATINTHDIAFGIAVNLSARLLNGQSIVTVVADTLARHGLDPARLTLEITETATLGNDGSIDTLHALRALGLRISIDDYGTGLSTLEYLKKIPASEIKIDRSFISAMLSSASDLLMVNSTIQLAHSLGHSVVAEGVETDEELARLIDLRCDIAQGYRIGRPMNFQDLARRLLAERQRAA